MPIYTDTSNKLRIRGTKVRAGTASESGVLAAQTDPLALTIDVYMDAAAIHDHWRFEANFRVERMSDNVVRSQQWILDVGFLRQSYGSYFWVRWAWPQAHQLLAQYGRRSETYRFQPWIAMYRPDLVGPVVHGLRTSRFAVGEEHYFYVE